MTETLMDRGVWLMGAKLGRQNPTSVHNRLAFRGRAGNVWCKPLQAAPVGIVVS